MKENQSFYSHILIYFYIKRVDYYNDMYSIGLWCSDSWPPHKTLTHSLGGHNSTPPRPPNSFLSSRRVGGPNLVEWAPRKILFSFYLPVLDGTIVTTYSKHTNI